MSIFVIGINHKTAPIALREKAYFAEEKITFYLQDILLRKLAEEIVLLSTCNRTEVYCKADNIAAIQDWFLNETSFSLAEYQQIVYTYVDDQAVSHMMHVACGLDSMVLGEPQILGQMKEAFSESCTVGAVGPLFNRLFQTIFSVAKEIRTTTAIGACPVSVASAAVHFAKEEFSKYHSLDFNQAKIVLLGAGSTTELLLRYLKDKQHAIAIVNRHLEKAAELAKLYGGKAFRFDQLESALTHADVVFSATESPLPILKKTTMMNVMAQRREPIILIDLAVPRDIEPSVAEVNHSKLFCIDDLKAIIEKNRQGREHAADKAREMIRKKSQEFIAGMKSLERVTHTIRAYRGQIEEICQVELIKAKEQLKNGDDPLQVLEVFANAFTKKLLHTPSVQLRQAGVEGRFELLRVAKKLFAIPDLETEHS